MSLGFIPVIISIILCEFITQDMSIYIGAGVGLLFSIYSVRHRERMFRKSYFTVLPECYCCYR